MNRKSRDTLFEIVNGVGGIAIGAALVLIAGIYWRDEILSLAAYLKGV
ncbi:hypothetical protein [Neorhizobium galegae]|nr:hypothetical protein [Neorhizobium galegae]CDZ55113.1 Hypothetical protein NGAL_HAMBI2427_60120 [Neorhizobium galegae bv. orientalis]